MANLLREAVRVVQDDGAPHGLQAVAVSALLAAFEQELQTPTEAPMAVWRWLSRKGGGGMALTRMNVIPGEDVVRQAVATLTNASAGDEVEDLAVTVIERASNLSSVTDADVVAATDGEPDPARARRVVWFLDAVHEQAGVSNAVLLAVRDRWARSNKPHLREASARVAALLPGLDRAFVEPLLADPAPKVRRAVAGLLGAAEGDDRTVAGRLLEARLGVEEHHRVRSDLHLALGSLVTV